MITNICTGAIFYIVYTFDITINDKSSSSLLQNRVQINMDSTIGGTIMTISKVNTFWKAHNTLIVHGSLF